MGSPPGFLTWLLPRTPPFRSHGGVPRPALAAGTLQSRPLILELFNKVKIHYTKVCIFTITMLRREPLLQVTSSLSFLSHLQNTSFSLGQCHHSVFLKRAGFHGLTMHIPLYGICAYQRVTRPLIF